MHKGSQIYNSNVLGYKRFKIIYVKRVKYVKCFKSKTLKKVKDSCQTIFSFPSEGRVTRRLNYRKKLTY